MKLSEGILLQNLHGSCNYLGFQYISFYTKTSQHWTSFSIFLTEFPGIKRYNNHVSFKVLEMFFWL